MPLEPTADTALPEVPRLLRALGWVAILGCVVFVVAVVIGDIVVPDHDWIADTISDLGAGRYELIADSGIYAFAAGLIACAVGASHAHLGGRRWSLGIGGLILLGLIVFLVGARNEYGDSHEGGVVIHRYLVYALGLLFAVVPWLMAPGAARVSRRLALLFRVSAVLWVGAAPWFFFLPDGWDGLYERGLGLLTFLFVVPMGLVLVGRARAIAGR
ncbi:DUF998 domain-containing protein [Jannaschia sp. M317]|uniref:DUF998 domain-containing protein n=1 Tax=Jannaschia sp. M317 TaxID=2867011 RepID=UPI0021A33D94|nr:DUF998 domain-containing protein [Jannaschia sp. M317]UWQ16108.1 DUF998 domain-containing protein [Jannaschia sp. M317]